ncbi:MAG: MATE family efflux transporter [Pseudomonadota bacterium]
MTRRVWPAWARAADIIDLLRLSAPIALSRMSVMLMSFTDAVVLGLNTTNELPLILNAWLPIGIAIAIGMGVLQGVQVISSELMGTGQTANTGRVWRRGMWTALVLGIVTTAFCWLVATPLYTALRFDADTAAGAANATRILSLGLVGHMVSVGCMLYLEALRKPNMVTAVMLGAVAFNLVLDLYLVGGFFGGPTLGYEGVAWATTISRYALTLALLVIIAFVTPGLKASEPAPKDEFRRQTSVGLGATISNVAEFSAFNFTFVIATWISLEAATAYGMAIQFIGVTFMAFLGIATATSVRVAEHFGRGDQTGVRDASRLGVVVGVLLGAVLTVFMLAFNDTLAALTVAVDPATGDDTAQALLAILLLFAALVILFDGLQVIGAYALRAQEIVWAPGAFHLGSYYLIMLPGAYWLGIVHGRGGQGVMEAVILATLCAGILQVGYLEYKTARRTNDAPLQV